MAQRRLSSRRELILYFSQWIASVLVAGCCVLGHASAWADIHTEKKEIVAEPHSGETVERYAERLLKLRMNEQARDAAPKPSSAPVSASPPKLENIGEVGPARFELVFIAGAKGQERVHLRIDGQYAKLLKAGEHFAGWRVLDIGSDFVDISKDGETTRLYLFSQTTPQSAEARRRRGPGDERGS